MDDHTAERSGVEPLRVYVDTSVFGGCLDAEFAAESQRFFALVHAGRIVVLISQVVVDELADAPQQVREVLESLPMESAVLVELTPEIIKLRNAYLAAGIVHHRYMDDATHVAAATVVSSDAIVSWNFRHIVRLDKMRAYNQVNIQAGYGRLSIVSPQEVRLDEDED
jgi:predicted nucleic acid-binding protein